MICFARVKGSEKIALLVITSDRGLAGAYNGSVLRAANSYIKAQEAAGNKSRAVCVGQERRQLFQLPKTTEITRRFDQFSNVAKFADVEKVADDFIQQFIDGKIDEVQRGVHQLHQRRDARSAEVMQLLPLAALEAGAKQAEQGQTGKTKLQVVYEFSPRSQDAAG